MADSALSPATAPTPVRSLAAENVDGCRVLTGGRSRYLDGSESQLLEIIGAARDISSLSDELAGSGRGWPQRYHLLPARANLLRPLALGPEYAVLEIGAGCGALTRYLGERCATVDAVEPVLERARVARRRTHDLPGVEVFVGGLEDVPALPAYDVAIVVGVLEYVGGGAISDEPYLAFLRGVAQRLRPGGTLVLAIENRLGVKYLAGAPEDHTARVWDSVEGYPVGAHARTHSRSALGRLLGEAGLETRFLNAFPDYKLTRVLLTDELFAVEPSLAWRIPHFPSPDWAVPRPHAISEAALWRELVRAGVGEHFGNSFVVLARKPGEDAKDLWPGDVIASFYQLFRRACFATETLVHAAPSGVHLTRAVLGGPAPDAPLRIQPTDSALVPGLDLLEVLEHADETALRELIGRWAALVGGGRERGQDSSIDCVPHNVVLTPEGALVAIDDEWHHREYTRSDVLARGALTSGHLLAMRTPPGQRGATTVEDVVRSLGAAAGLPHDGDWLADAVRREARLQAEVTVESPDVPVGMSAAEHVEALLWDELRTSLDELPLGRRVDERLSDVQGELERTRAELAAARAREDDLRCELQEAVRRGQESQANFEMVINSRAWRVTRPLREASAAVRRRRGG